MQPDTTLHPCTVIDYTACRRAARAARTSALADRPTRRLALRLTSVGAAAIAIVTAAAGLQAGVSNCHGCAAVRAERIDDRGRAWLPGRAGRCAPETATSALRVPFW